MIWNFGESTLILTLFVVWGVAIVIVSIYMHKKKTIDEEKTISEEKTMSEDKGYVWYDVVEDWVFFRKEDI